MDQGRVDRSQGLGPKTQPLGRPWCQVLDKYVRFTDEPLEGSLTIVAF